MNMRGVRRCAGVIWVGMLSLVAVQCKSATGGSDGGGDQTYDIDQNELPGPRCGRARLADHLPGHARRKPVAVQRGGARGAGRHRELGLAELNDRHRAAPLVPAERLVVEPEAS